MNTEELNSVEIGAGQSSPNLWLTISQSLAMGGDLVVSLAKNLSASVSMSVDATNNMAHMVGLRVSESMSVGGDLVSRTIRSLYLSARGFLSIDGTLSPSTIINLGATRSMSADASLTPATYRGLSASQSLAIGGDLSADGLYTGKAPASRTFVSSCPSNRVFKIER